MSFLVDDVDQLATLEVALALIDSCDDTSAGTFSSSSDTLNSSDDIYNSSDDVYTSSGADLFAEMPDVSFDALVTGAEDVDELFVSPAVMPPSAPPRKKPAAPPKKARSNAGAVARHRERKKAETQLLRSQAAELEAALAQLQQTRKTRTNALLFLLEQRRAAGEEGKAREISPKLVSAWLDRAALQAQERFKAEALNVKLKDAVAQQMRVIQSLQDILGRKPAAVQGLDLLLEAQKEDLHHDFRLAQEDRVFQELRDGLKQMYFVADALFDLARWAEPLDSVSCSTQVKHDPVGGAYVEVRSNTPLQSGFASPAKAMWERMCCMPCSKETNYHVKKRVITDTSYQKCYTMFIDGPDGQPLELRGVSFVEKVDEPRRMVWLWRSLLVTADSDGPRFLEKGWTISENVGSNRGELSLRPSSVYRTCYQASCDSRGSASAQHQQGSDVQRNALIETVLRTLGSRTRAHQQFQQNMLLDEFSGPRLPAPLIQMLA